MALVAGTTPGVTHLGQIKSQHLPIRPKRGTTFCHAHRYNIEVKILSPIWGAPNGGQHFAPQNKSLSS